MTREEVREARARINDAPFGVMREWLLKACNALEVAWAVRIEDSATYRIELARLRERIETLEKERDDALKEGLALTVEKDGMQALIDDLRKGHERYETARRLDPTQWADVWALSLNTSKPFDEIIDDLRPFVAPDKPVVAEFGGCE